MGVTKMNLLETAKQFATAAHASINQKRKYTGEDYIVHPANVAYLTSLVTDDPVVIAAAWLHDVVEDVNTEEFNPFDIMAIFGNKVFDLVWWLTDISKPEDGNRDVRKKLDAQHIIDAPFNAQIIKLADIIDNAQSIFTHDPNFYKIYIRECNYILDNIGFPNSSPLWDLANFSINKRVF